VLSRPDWIGKVGSSNLLIPTGEVKGLESKVLRLFYCVIASRLGWEGGKFESSHPDRRSQKP
jgi:hypothetical protein